MNEILDCRRGMCEAGNISRARSGSQEKVCVCVPPSSPSLPRSLPHHPLNHPEALVRWTDERFDGGAGKVDQQVDQLCMCRQTIYSEKFSALLLELFMTLSVRRSVGLLVHNFLKGREVPWPYRRNCLDLQLTAIWTTLYLSPFPRFVLFWLCTVPSLIC